MSMRGAIAVLVALLVGAARASAAPGVVEGTVAVERPTAQEPERIVVYLVGFSEPAPPATARVLQQEKRFLPALVAITAGQKVAFPNGDPFLHNVFSSSPRRRFDLGSFPVGESRERRFPAPGVVDVFCNIHPDMSATILVLPNRRFSFASADGRFHLEGVPPGRWTVFAYSRAAGRPAGQPVEVVAGGTTTVDLHLVEGPLGATHPNKFGEAYKESNQVYK